MKPLADCCLTVVAKYEAIIGGAREGAALYCKTCHARIVHADGAWETEAA